LSDWQTGLERMLAEARAAGRLAELRALLSAALERAAPAAAPEPAAAGPELPGRFGLIGDSPGMKKLYDLIERVAPSDVPVLIQGETGTGKELVARALHARSRRAPRTFLAENCAAVPANLLESELFGHKKGSFTHAIADRPGHFVVADKGTLFLDEIGDMPLEMQAKLLRVLENGELRPVGSSQVVKVDVRILAATHRDLAAMVQERRFREDLYYRLKVIRLDIPPLRERGGDIELLVRYFLGKFAGPETSVEPAALRALRAYSWPGNVRQLENEIRRAVALGHGRIELDELSADIQAASEGR
jgi:transcriptional regulator with GAF, ATPase, and Fis domain